ncbi:bifunctional diaminohydroxyphosphoribosylaminopyrimidine deaminase/5-amino-6-(5-phosphoribosylamino)uracil reductase RibD [Pseudozobellia thermophila]|uniref:bifunctional diaminohydroxyphosphoribosylaminopyrimidine deaminase/5-amino-6-(5-phosphoribosylamino)uracil reductase RibD n=1 Tax=Pseudozobellia thermophila TaxID=192903 RepID=UPI0009330C58
MNIHRKYMLRCLQIAKNGLGTTAPNPMVGCLIVHNSKIIGEGYTSPYGGPHAEVNAINSVADKSLLKDATLYVTLEPCSHFGKTPPCADLIVAHQVGKVVIGLLDPHVKVAGKGIQKLRDAGISVEYGIMEAECREHHRRFLCFHEKGRPYIILKWAQTTDGFIAPERNLRKSNPEPYWITNTYSRQLVHKWRSEEQAILVGTHTVTEDNPKLDVRSWTGKNPLRVVLDREMRLDTGYHVMDGKTPTLMVSDPKHRGKGPKTVTYAFIDFSKNVVGQLCDVLHEHNITSIIVEGGAKTLQSFIATGLWDEARVFTGTTSFKKGLRAPTLSGRLVHTKRVATDTLNIYRND